MNWLKRSDSVDMTKNFKQQTEIEAEKMMALELKKLLQTESNKTKRELYEKQFNSFLKLFKRYLDNSHQEMIWEKIALADNKYIADYNSLSEPDNPNVILDHLNKLAIVKLNGGLGTSMGCIGTKSLITVRADLTFLDLTIRQIEHLNTKYDCNVPLVLMNSFNTNDETVKVLQKYQILPVLIYTFVQSMYPRINKESLLPLCSKLYSEGANSKLEDSLRKTENEAWYPPGHGDLYRSLFNGGILQELIDKDIEWIFVSNIDNLGASVDTKILSYLINSHPDNRPDFVMEVTEKTRADVKGGTLINYQNKLRLLELAQVPKDHIDEFTSIRKFDIFNTNNLWINLKSLVDLLIEDQLDMEIIVNPKTLDNGLNIIQLEEASGSAIKSFNRPIGLKVPRSRFLPVKTTSDLLLVMSNIYTMRKDRLIMSPKREFTTVPVVKLGSDFKKVKAFLQRFENIPNMLELDHLTVSGDVTFGKDVILRGTVIIIANYGETINIPSGSILENKIVSGNLRIMDH